MPSQVAPIDSLPPVVLVPGILGSRLEAHYNLFGKRPPTCPSKKDAPKGWFSLFVVFSGLFASFASQCWFSLMALEYSPGYRGHGGRFRGKSGVSIRAKAFGKVESIAYQDDDKIQPYFAPVISALQTQLGYVPDDNIVAAPYDFRFAPTRQWKRHTKELIEDAVRRNDRKPAIMYTHSLGCLYMLEFLQSTSSFWRRRYVSGWVGVGCPFAGSPNAAFAYATEDRAADRVKPEFAAEDRRTKVTFESLLFLLPNKFGYQDRPNYPIVIDAARQANYSSSDMGDFVQAALRAGEAPVYHAEPGIRRRVESAVQQGPPKDISSTFIFRTGIPTPQQFKYDQGLRGDVTPVVTLEGDETVTDDSRKVCEMWNQSKCITLENTPTELPTGATILDHSFMHFDPQSLAILASAIQDV